MSKNQTSNGNQWEKIYQGEGQSYKYYSILELPHVDMDKVIGIFKKNKVKKILDLGCGAGRNTWYLADKGFEVYGLDNAPTGLKILRRALKERGLAAKLEVGDAFASLPYADNSFDALVSVQVMQHAKESVIIKAIKEIVRVVKPGGLIFITLCGRCSKGKVRYCLVQTAKKIAPNTYVPTQGNETGLTHFIYNQDLVHKHYKDFKIMDLWRDDKDYYAFVGRNNKSK